MNSVINSAQSVYEITRNRCTYAQYLRLVHTHSTYASTDYDHDNADGDNGYYDDDNDNNKLLCRCAQPKVLTKTNKP